MSDEVAAFILRTLDEMNFDVADAGPGSLLGPAGIDLDSLSVVELAVRIEDAYGVKLTGEEMEGMAMATVGELAAEVTGRAALAVPAESVPR
jgi:acyl carrier protein